MDITDLILITTLQHFEPSIYQNVFENISELGGESVNFDDDKVFAARFLPKNALDGKAAKKALAHLFPRLAKGWNEHVWDGTVYLKKREHRRLCTREYYRNYFLFGRDPDRNSRADVEGILTGQNPAVRLREMIENLTAKKSRQGASRVAALLDQILEIVFSKPLLSDAAVMAILDCSDDIVAKKDIVWELLVTDNLERLDSILVFGLTPLEVGDREDRLRRISTYPRGLSLCARVVSHLARQHGLHGGQAQHESEQLVSKASVEQAEGALLDRIRKAAKESCLLSTATPIFLIWIWKDLAGADEVKDWISHAMKSDGNVLKLAELLPSTSYHSGSDGQKEVRSIKAEIYKGFLDVEVLQSRLNDIVASNTLPISQQVRSDFLAALEAGKASRF